MNDTTKKNEKPAQLDAETLLHTLDQLTQTMDIMSKVILRLKHCLHHQLDDNTRSMLNECEDSLSKITEQAIKGRTLH